MEIIGHSTNYSITLVFKIDLIVWKYIKGEFVFQSSSWFKIDLIVWKFISE